jgi:hypothetical protein
MVSSTLPVAVLCTATTHPDGVEPYSIGIEGSHSLAAVNGVGITYDVDDAALGEWLTANPAMADSIKAITQAELDALALTEGQYGFELGLTPEAMSAEAALGRMTPDDTRATVLAAAGRRRDAEAGRRQAGMLRRQADTLEEHSKAEITAADAAHKAATEALAAKAPPPAAAAARPAQAAHQAAHQPTARETREAAREDKSR